MKRRNPEQSERYWELRDECIRYNLKLVVSVARGYRRFDTRIDIVDLISEGNIGLLHALRKFDPKRGYKFSTYAVWWIRQVIEKRLRYNDRLIKIPDRKVDKIRKIQKESPKYLTIDDLEERDDLNEDEIRAFRLMYSRKLSTDDLHQHNEAKVSVDMESDLEQKLFADKIRDIVVLLRPEYRRVIELRFGLCEDQIEHSLGEISKKIGCSKQWVSHLEKEGLSVLKSILIHRGIVTTNNV